MGLVEPVLLEVVGDGHVRVVREAQGPVQRAAPDRRLSSTDLLLTLDDRDEDHLGDRPERPGPLEDDRERLHR